MAASDIIIVLGIVGIAIFALFALPQMQQAGSEDERPSLEEIVQDLGSNLNIRIPDFSGQYTKSPMFVPNLAKSGGNLKRIPATMLPPSQTTTRRGPIIIPNLVGPKTLQTLRPTYQRQPVPRQTITRPRITSNMPQIRVIKPRYTVNKILQTRCIVEPKATGNFWVCYTPDGRKIPQGREWTCRGLKARYQNLGHVCRP